MRRLKQEKGSITLFVLVSMLFFVLFLAGMYMLSNAKEQTGISETAKIKEIYEKDVNNIDNVYATLANNQNVNPPVYKNTGLVPVTIASDGTVSEANTTYSWYSYDGEQNHWANAKTADGSMFVWIPRFAYKITYTNASDKSKGGTIDVVFLKERTNLDFKGNDVTSDSYIDENGVTGAYIVHPAFQDGTSNSFANGEWNEKITGFWMAKFEAAYQDADKAVDSNATYTTIMSYQPSGSSANLASYYYGTRAVGTKIKYPVFQANKPSLNYIGISDAYDMCREMTSVGNPYYLTSSVNSHLTKNSEWGAVAYLTESKYGRNGEEVTINNINLNGVNTVHAVTGYAGATVSAGTVTTNITAIQNGQVAGSWTTSQGQNASSTKNIYGIYDLSGGLWEWTAGYIVAGDYYTKYAGSLAGESNEYRSKYAGTSGTDTANYLASPNPARVGEAIWETSTAGTGAASWNSDNSNFPYTTEPFFLCGGHWGGTTTAGTFAFGRSYGYCCLHFRFPSGVGRGVKSNRGYVAPESLYYDRGQYNFHKKFTKTK